MIDNTKARTASEARIRAGLNLLAVLPNLEELTAHDPESAQVIAGWDIAFRLKVPGGPQTDLVFQDNTCRVGPNLAERPGVLLLFLSSGHCNRVFDGKLPPLPVKGWTRFTYLKGFSKLSERLAYFLKPSENLFENRNFLALNTLMTINTAAFAVQELTAMDPHAMLNAARVRDGAVVMKLAGKPVVSVIFQNGKARAAKGGADNPMAEMSFRDVKAANAFLNGRSDTFAAVASGAVQLRGQVPMLEQIGLILDRLPGYLAP